jgi:hypothetical protein
LPKTSRHTDLGAGGGSACFADNTAWVDLKDLSKYIDWDRLDNGAEYWITGVVTDASGQHRMSIPYVLYRPKRREREIVVGATNQTSE